MLMAFLLATLQGYPVPATFEKGASKQGFRTKDLLLDPRLVREYATLAVEGKVADLVRQDAKWLPYIIDGLISDDEKIALASLGALSDYCVKHRISASEEGFRNPVRIEYFNSAYYRAGERTTWGEWWLHHQNSAAQIKWDEVMQHFRAGGDLNDAARPEGVAFSKVKALGPAAYSHLARYIDHEDPLLGRAAVAVLNALTGRSAPAPTEANKAQRKGEWEAWLWGATLPSRIAPEILALLECEVAEAEVQALVERLSNDDPAERRKAVAALRPCVLRHEQVLTRMRLNAKDVETRAGLDELLAYRGSVEPAIEAVHADPEMLLEGVEPRTSLETGRNALAEHLRLSRPAKFLSKKPAMAEPAGQWSYVIRFLETKGGSAEEKAADRREIGRVEALAREDLDRLGKKATLLVEEGKKVEGLELLKGARPRFELTRWAAELQKLIEELDQ